MILYNIAQSAQHTWNCMTVLDFNDPAPDLDVRLALGGSVRLSALWSQQPLLLAFTRHFGCTQCKEMLDRLRAGQPQLEAAHLRLAVVTQGAAEAAAEFCGRFAPPGSVCLSDPERQAYAAYGLERGSLFQTVLSPRIWKAVNAAAKKGYHLEPPPAGQDVRLMSGTFIIGRDGRIRLPYYYADIADHPPMEALIQGFLDTDWDKPLAGPFGPGA